MHLAFSVNEKPGHCKGAATGLLGCFGDIKLALHRVRFKPQSLERMSVDGRLQTKAIDVLYRCGIIEYRKQQGSPMNVILYARVSTAEQAADGVSLDAQQAKLRAYADLYDLTVVDVIVDAGESAKSLKRPGLQHALQSMKSGKVDGLVIAKLDRLTRSVADWQTLIDGYFGEKAGKALYSVGDSIDTTTAGGRLVLNVLLSVSQWEREAVAERTKAALLHKITNGERCGKVRFGYDLAADGVTLVENELEQQAITMIQELRESGMSLRKIAIELDARGIATKEGRPWNHNSVAGILKRAA